MTKKVEFLFGNPEKKLATYYISVKNENLNYI
jgi:hypothetical protein